MKITVWKRRTSSQIQTCEECKINVQFYIWNVDILSWTTYTTHFPDDNYKG